MADSAPVAAADPSPRAPVAAPPRWRGIDELAGLVGAYCWLEHRIFTVSGSWATGPSDAEPALRVWCAAVSRRHGALAQRWAERLPLRAGVDRASLVKAPSGPLDGLLGALADEPAARAGITALVTTLLPRLVDTYTTHLREASPVSEAPVMEVLAEAGRAVTAEIRDGAHLLAPRPGDVPLEGSDASARLSLVVAALEQAFVAAGVFPAGHAS